MATLHIHADQLRPAFLRRLNDHLQALSHPDYGDRPNPGQVHQARVRVKQTRALLQLLDKASDACVHSLDREVKAIARALAGSRDAHVLEKTLARLITDPEQRSLLLPPLLHALACTSLAPASRYRPPTLVLQQLAELEPGISTRTLLQGYARIRRKTRRHAKTARKTREDEALHRWRKWVKYSLFTLQWLVSEQILCKSDRKGARRQIKTLTGLGERLGQFQDICVLEVALERVVYGLSTHDAAVSGLAGKTASLKFWYGIQSRLRKRKSKLKRQCLKALRTKTGLSRLAPD